MIEQLTDLFRRGQVLVVGDLMLDEYILGNVSRISPEAPVPVLDVRTRSFVLGGAANVAANIKALGADVAVVGLAAFDLAGEKLRELFGKAGIETAGLVDAAERGTISKTRVVAGQQQVVRIDNESRSAVAPQQLQEALTKAIRHLPGSQVVILSDYAKGLLAADLCSAVIAECNARNLPVIVDPKTSNFTKYRGCTVITPNLAEAAAATGITINSPASLEQAGGELLLALPGTNVLITRGPDGMTLFRRNEQALTIPTVARQVFDVVGAGDTVVAALSVSLAAGFPLTTAIRIANIAAGIAVEKPGTATISVAEIIAHDTIGEFRQLLQTRLSTPETL